MAKLPIVLDGGRFHIRECIGYGGMATVWRAYDTVLQRDVAIKILNDTQDQAARARFIKEAQTMAGFSHPNIVTIYEYRRNGHTFIVMELLKGMSCANWLNVHGPMRPYIASRIIISVLEALAQAHAVQKVHRDVKPGNVQVDGDAYSDANNVELNVKLLDFGIMREIGQPGVTQTDQFIGSLWYAAPEQLRNAEAIDHRSDLYSVAATLHALLCNPNSVNMPRELYCCSDTSSHLLTCVPEPLHAFIKKASAFQQKDRYQTANEMRASLESILPMLVELPAAHSTTPRYSMVDLLSNIAEKNAMLYDPSVPANITPPGDMTPVVPDPANADVPVVAAQKPPALPNKEALVAPDPHDPDAAPVAIKSTGPDTFCGLIPQALVSPAPEGATPQEDPDPPVILDPLMAVPEWANVTDEPEITPPKPQGNGVMIGLAVGVLAFVGILAAIAFGSSGDPTPDPQDITPVATTPVVTEAEMPTRANLPKVDTAPTPEPPVAVVVPRAETPKAITKTPKPEPKPVTAPTTSAPDPTVTAATVNAAVEAPAEAPKPKPTLNHTPVTSAKTGELTLEFATTGFDSVTVRFRKKGDSDWTVRPWRGKAVTITVYPEGTEYFIDGVIDEDNRDKSGSGKQPHVITALP